MEDFVPWIPLLMPRTHTRRSTEQEGTQSSVGSLAWGGNPSPLAQSIFKALQPFCLAGFGAFPQGCSKSQSVHSRYLAYSHTWWVLNKYCVFYSLFPIPDPCVNPKLQLIWASIPCVCDPHLTISSHALKLFPQPKISFLCNFCTHNQVLQRPIAFRIIISARSPPSCLWTL